MSCYLKFTNKIPQDLEFQESETGNLFFVILIPIIGFVMIAIYFKKRKSNILKVVFEKIRKNEDK